MIILSSCAVIRFTWEESRNDGSRCLRTEDLSVPPELAGLAGQLLAQRMCVPGWTSFVSLVFIITEAELPLTMFQCVRCCNKRV